MATVLSPREGLRSALSAAAFIALLGGCAIAPSIKATADDSPAAPAPEAPPSTGSPITEIAPPPPPAAPSVAESPTAQAQFHIMAGELAAGRQQPKVAAQEFLEALDVAPTAELAERATNLAVQANDDALSLTAARRWIALQPASLDAREVIVRLALRSGLDDEVYGQCERIVRDHPGGPDDGFHYVAQLLSQEPAHADAAMGVMNRLVDLFPKLAGSHRALSLLALRFNRVDLAEKAARDSLAIQPQSKESSLMLVGALVRKGDVEQSDQIMESLLKNNNDANDLRENYAQLLLQSNQRKDAREQLDRVLKSNPNDLDAHNLLGLLDLDERRLDDAQAHFEFLLHDNDRHMDAEYYLGRVAELRHDPAGALAHYEKVTSGSQALDAVVRRAAMLAKLGRVDEAQSYLEQLGNQIPQLSERFLLAEGDLLMDNGSAEKAMALYNQELIENPDDADVLYARSIAYERLNHVDQAEADLRKILEKNPDDARTLNALGYMLTIHSSRLDEAQQLINRALVITPDEPAVIDSEGWLRYRQGHPQDALPLLKRAYELFPDAEVAAHLGEVLWSLGDKDEARSIWTQASKNDPDNVALRDTVKRFTQ